MEGIHEGRMPQQALLEVQPPFVVEDVTLSILAKHKSQHQQLAYVGRVDCVLLIRMATRYG